MITAQREQCHARLPDKLEKDKPTRKEVTYIMM